MSDPIIRTHFTSLYDNLLEQNLLRIVEPFSRVEVAHVAALVGLPVVEIEFKYILNPRRVNRQVESDDSG